MIYRLNINDPRMKQYLDSLEPKYRKMLEEQYLEQQSSATPEAIDNNCGQAEFGGG